MLPTKKNPAQMSFNSSFEEQLNHKHPLYILANLINWEKFEKEFSKHYNDKMGRPAKPIRQMTGLLILKHIRNLSDETVRQLTDRAVPRELILSILLWRGKFCNQAAL
jgi:hypothetical protein